VRLIKSHKAIIAVVFVSVILINAAEKADPDEKPDSNDISAYYGFDEMEIIKLDWGISGLRIADFNADGRNDIAVVNNRKARIEILTQKEDVGPGETPVAVDADDIDINAITPPTRFHNHSVPVSQKIFSFVCGDLNSDGMTDLAFYGEPKGLYVILQKPVGTQTDKPKTLYWHTREKINIDDALLTYNALACADLNNDGRDDLALAGQNVVYITLQKKDGSLAQPLKYPATERILALDVADLNGDNINDLILITNDGEKPLHARLGNETGQLGPQIRFFIEKPFALKTKDSEGTAGDEILTVDGRSGRLICYKFAGEKETSADWPILFYPLPSGQGNTKRDLVVGDFDGDGLVDVVISDPDAAELILYRQTATIGLAEPLSFPAFADIAGLSAADIDGDGKTEIAVLSVKEKIIGISRFEDDRLSFPKPVNLKDQPLAAELADVDGNGSIDCLYIAADVNDTRTLRVIYNLGATNAGEIESELALDKLTSNPEGVKVLDVDQDGLQDALIFVQYESPILVRQTKKTKFELIDSPKVRASLIKDASLSSIAVADVDGENGRELLVAQKNFARSLVLADGSTWVVIDQYNSGSRENKISAVAAFDIDGQGLQSLPAILLLDGQKGRLEILKAGDDKTYRLEKDLDVGRWNEAARLKMLFAPLTGNNTKSILLFDSEKFALTTPPAAGQPQPHLEQQFSYETKIKDGIYGNLTAGDINSDDRVDIIMVEYKNNHIEILALDSRLKPIPAMRFKIFEQKSYRDSKSRGNSKVEPRELTVADVTGDGKNDLVTVIHDRIIIYPQD